MLVLWILFLTAFSFFVGSTGLGFYFYYFADLSHKIDYIPIVMTALFSGWAVLGLANGIHEESLSADDEEVEVEK